MPDSCEVCRITDADIDAIVKQPRAIFIACIRKDEHYQENMVMLRYIAEYYQRDLLVYVALEDMFAYFRDAYAVIGTPTYLILEHGGIKGIILGNKPYDTLIKLIGTILQGYAHQDISQVKGGD
ncbi:MAG: hypothetical protein ABFD81_14925 [Syntrophaceae bacterium]